MVRDILADALAKIERYQTTAADRYDDPITKRRIQHCICVIYDLRMYLSPPPWADGMNVVSADNSLTRS